MGLIKRRPEIQLLAPSAIHVGETFEVEVVLTCEAPVECDAIRLEVEGTMKTLDSQQHARVTHLYRAVAELRIDGELAAGEHRRRFRLKVPADAAPRYRGRYVVIRHGVSVRVDIPWWPDAKAEFDLMVIEPAHHRSDPARFGPGVYGSREDGGAGGKPYLELALASRLLTAEEPLEAAVSLFNTDRHAYRGIRVKLLAQETVSTGTYVRSVLAWTIPVSNPAEGETMRVRLQIPETLVPAFSFARNSVSWSLEASADLTWGDPVVRVPVDVARDARGHDARLAEVGNVRIGRVWSTVAEALGMTSEAGAMAMRIGACEVRLERAGSVGVDATIRFPELDGLGLGLERGGWRDRIGARDPAHAAIAIERLDALCEATGVTHLDDHGARAHHDRAGRNPDPLREYATHLMRLGRELDELSAGLEAPAALADRVEEFVALADALDGRWEPASMRIRGQRHGTRWGVAPRWDGDRMVALAVAVHPDPPIEGRHHLHWRAEDDAQPRTALELHADAWRGALALEVDAESMRSIVNPDVDPASELVQIIRPKLEALLGLCQARVSGGAYR